jgi:uncharacterized membrane protein YbhN (UPF0104 family)
MSKSGTTPKTIKKILQVSGSLFSAGLFIWLLSKQDWDQVFSILKQMPYWTIPLALVLIFSGQLVNAWRWWLLVRSQDVEISYLETLKIVVAGSYASNFLPSTIGGDVVRVMGMLNYARSRVLVVSSVLVDRAINVASYLALSPLSMWVFDISTIFAAVPSGYHFAFGLFPAGWIERIRAIVARLLSSLKKSFLLWLHSPGVILKAVLISWLSLIVVFLGVWILAVGIQIPVSLFDVIAVSVIVYALTLLPVSVNGLGVRELAVTALYIQLGASLEQASTLAIVTRFLSLISTLPGALWLHRGVIREYPLGKV